MKPAWSWQFEDEKLQEVSPIALPTRLTRDWAWGDSTGKGVRVAIIDSGIDSSHPDVGAIQGGAALEYDDDAEDVRIVEGPHEDLFGHGTACAAIIRKVAPQASLYSIRVLGEKLSGKGIVFAAALRWAIEQRMHVVNLSLSTKKREYFDVFHELADDAYFHHMMLVAAVNNVPAPSYPSQYASVFSVASHGERDPYRFYYNPSPPVEFGGPGIDLQVAWLNGATIEATGNSFAAPHIAGLVAKILGKHPGMTPFQMKTVLHGTASNAAPE